MRAASRRRPLVALTALTVVLLLVDLAGGGSEPGVGGLHSVVGAVFGPLERLLSPGRPSASSAGATVELVARSERLRQSQSGGQLARLVAAPALAGATLVPARVVGVGRQGAAGPERVTIDVGSRDGIRTDLCVVDADGLVGRVVSVAPWTADVALVGGPEIVVAVRVGSPGTLGSVTSGAHGARSRAPGLLDLTLVQRGAVRGGEQVTTLGSVGGSPYPPGLPVGTVTAMDPSSGDLAPTGAVRPAVDVTTLDIVGVLTVPPRVTPRAAVKVGG
jgi:rod shape-determining protein MreC